MTESSILFRLQNANNPTEMPIAISVGFLDNVMVDNPMEVLELKLTVFAVSFPESSWVLYLPMNMCFWI